jgi:uncharacterized repeat protein (TIGR01451 family)
VIHQKLFPPIIVLLALLLIILTPPLVEGAPQENWLVVKNGNEVRIHYGSGTDFPQYGVLHLNDSYFRLNYGPISGWGTSVILLPAFWSGGVYYQGAPITATWQVEGSQLVLLINSSIASLNVSSEVRLWPPKKNEAITAQVTTNVQGSILLDSRPGEAFKPVTLSSMHISSTIWDTQAAYGCLRTSPIPASGWIFQPPADVNIFGLHGGTSAWKTNAPTIEVVLDRILQVTGWVTSSSNPNDDNVAFWAASDEVLSSWSYRVTAAPTPGPKYNCLSLSKQASPSPVQDGASLTYTIQVTNTAGVTLNASISDTLPSQVTPTGVLNWAPIIMPGDVWAQLVTVTVQTGYTGSLTNKVQVTTGEGPMGTVSIITCANYCITYLPVILKGASS